MYIFEFYHTLNEDDLNYIWQGLPPDIALKHEEVVSSISHPLLAKELLGGGFYNDNTRMGQKVPEKIKWMVFKVKRKAKKNYYRKIFSKAGQRMPHDIPENLNYNWPYDFFSLVELAKIEAEFTFSDITLDGSNISNVPRGKQLFEKSSRTDALLTATNDPLQAANAIFVSEAATSTSAANSVGVTAATANFGTTQFDDSPDQPTEIPADFPDGTDQFFDIETPDESVPVPQGPADSVSINNPPPANTSTPDLT